ncbi:hypothetical protein [Salibacterium sp. K-3]
MTVTAKDLQGNLVSGLEIKYDISVTDEASIDEKYQIDDKFIDGDATNNLISTTEGDGTLTFDIVVPDNVDSGDGFELTFHGNELQNTTIAETTIAYSKF